MRVAHVVHVTVPAYSGLLTATVGMTRALTARGCSVELWQFGPWTEAGADPAPQLASTGVKVVTFQRCSGRFPLRATTRQAITDSNADVVHLHGVFTPGNNMIARHLNAPYVVSPHGGYASESLAYHRRRKVVFTRLFELPMLNGAGLITALTDDEAKQVRDLGVKSPAVVIPNGIDPPPADLDASRLKVELGLEEGTRLVGYVGRLDMRAKRLDRLLHGIAEAPGWHVALMGADFRGQLSAINALVTRLGIADRVHFPPPRRGRALQEALRGAGLFALLSRSEGLPMALLEALAVGTPSLVSKEVDRTIGVVAVGGGWLVDPSQVGEMLAQLGALDDDEWFPRRRAATAIAARYSWDDVAASLKQAYESIL